VSGDKARELFADGVRQLDDALVKSASATHGALQQLASRGQDFTDNDLKEAMVSGLFSTARELPRLREISMVCGMGSETSCVALALLRCSSTEDMHCGRTVAGEIGPQPRSPDQRQIG
jgi:Family of unknown function (DUF6781)